MLDDDPLLTRSSTPESATRAPARCQDVGGEDRLVEFPA